jgi:hypothetical protein
MKNIVIFNSFGRVWNYRLKCTLLLTSVPVFCSLSLLAILYFVSQQNLYFLEISGLVINELIRQGYRDQVILEMANVVWMFLGLFIFTFGISYVLSGWVVSPFVNAEKILRGSLKDRSIIQEENDWLSESPHFHKLIWGLCQRLTDRNFPFDKIEEVEYQFSYRFFTKFVVAFSFVAVMTGYITSVMLDVVHIKIVSLALKLIKIQNKGHYFLAQEELLNAGVYIITGISIFAFVIIGFYLTRYMSNMIFVFTRAIREHHFPLVLRDSDVYHGLADAISEVARECRIEGRKEG